MNFRFFFTDGIVYDDDDRNGSRWHVMKMSRAPRQTTSLTAAILLLGLSPGLHRSQCLRSSKKCKRCFIPPSYRGPTCAPIVLHLRRTIFLSGGAARAKLRHIVRSSASARTGRYISEPCVTTSLRTAHIIGAWSPLGPCA